MQKLHTIAETLILSLDMVDAFGASDVAKQLKTVPLSYIKVTPSSADDDHLSTFLQRADLSCIICVFSYLSGLCRRGQP